ncbi:histidinol-phosphate transaminase [Sphingomonadales bacterium 56]|uniref:Histidinol-phosphate aminotransferase n=1 Tax=Sphingobium agri TaxID=2933566 RepID=A0ABT0DTL6_9SPHN|nr:MULTISPECIES: histidinol-phosphate transaminase [Sphingobium]MBY2929612.1 histidinol-phosphate transaminase [Sphingomonadales bacterium 56]MBY2958546.1 histidinol-phosphate transaminase [Sphingomonadales bacterium 58]MCK0530460.1 histidinol-phosphate transaminase [Sphingobium agri]CAD7337296.1 Histidinol-phosphate aminotransferase [Sphingobium sp. S8]CAD7339707.1 Histidinol-phosphate aminotransferase [Sphingobium sp. S6]
MTKPAPKEWILGISPYVPGKAAADDGRPLIKLSANENPLGTGEAARAALIAATADLATYPDPGAAKMREAIAAVHGLDPARVIYGTGSDELLHIAASAYAGPGDEILYVKYGFSVYDIAARRVGATPVIAPDKDYATDVDALLACVTEKTKVVFLANPNNPTGTMTPREEIARLHASLRPDILFVLDQAYAEYLDANEDDGGLELARNASNVLVTRTFSKIYGLAAERIGWGYASAEIIDALHRIRAPFNVTTAGQSAAIAAVTDQAWVEASRAHNRQWRQWLADEIAALSNHGLRAVPSKANFLLILFNGKLTAEAAMKGLWDEGFATRWLPGQGLPNGLRITIGTEEQVRAVAAKLRAMAETA